MIDDIQKIQSIDLPRGKHCFIWNKYKVFDYKDVIEGTEDVESSDGGISVQDMSIIQNICWLYGLAPRIYGVHRVRFFNKIYICQDIEVLDYRKKASSQAEAEEVYDKVKRLGWEMGLWDVNRRDVSVVDVLEGKLVDFGSFKLEPDWQEKLKAIVAVKARYGKTYYQSMPLWNLMDAPRDSEKRVEEMQLDSVSFKNKSVLDLGCANGFFCRYASRMGASSILGIDHKSNQNDDPIIADYLLAFGKRFHNIEFNDIDLSMVNLNTPHDIVFYLSMNFHIGIPKWLPDVTGELCIFEDNSKQRDAKEELETMFSKVEFKGLATDHGDKPIYYCYK